MPDAGRETSGCDRCDHGFGGSCGLCEAGRETTFNVEADAREGHAERMGHNLPVEERRERAVGRRTP